MQHNSIFSFLLSLLLSLIVIAASANMEKSATYIIHMDRLAIPASMSDHHSWYASTLQSLRIEGENAPIHLYTYKHVMDGFSAVLSESQLSQLEKMPGHVATYAERVGKRHTTHSPKFLGLKKQSGLWPAANFGDDMIIGMFDTGIWPESESFSDHGMPPVPLRWRGTCESGIEFNSSDCNRKLIGARSFRLCLETQKTGERNGILWTGPLNISPPVIWLQRGKQGMERNPFPTERKGMKSFPHPRPSENWAKEWGDPLLRGKRTWWVSDPLLRRKLGEGMGSFSPSKKFHETEDNIHEVSSLTVAVLVRIARILLLEQSASLWAAYGEVYEIIHFVEDKMKTMDIESRKKQRLAEAVRRGRIWKNPNTQGSDEAVTRNPETNGTMQSQLEFLDKEFPAGLISDEIRYIKEHIGRSTDKLCLYCCIQQLFVDIVRMFLTQLPHALCKGINDGTAEDFHEIKIKAEEFHAKFNPHHVLFFAYWAEQQNRTIIYPDEYDSPRDSNGHGTHTSSTAAGSFVEDVDYFGYAKGTAVGIAPQARLAMYKVIFSDDTFDTAATDTLAGMDQAIEDGVDLMSLSLGFGDEPLYDNPISVGAFAAIEKGIFVASGAGNDGPDGYTVQNAAPWITTVGAGTIDREFLGYVTLGDGVATIKGKSIYPGDSLVSKVSLYYGKGDTSKQNCEINSLDSKDVSGKFVFCSFSNKTNISDQVSEVSTAGAKGAIIATDAVSAKLLYPFDFYMPFVAISIIDGQKVEDYLSKTSNATVDVKFQITELGTKPAPQVGDFSSRGPSRRSPWILKPDVLAPGVDILAAWVPNRGEAPVGNNYLFTDYALNSGTSMSTPHVAGIAALLKSTHRDWSSAAIRSAMMTTADVADNTEGQIPDMVNGAPATPLDFGAGHVNPNKALDPGLVYDIETEDYINFLCAINYTSQQIQAITRRSNYPCEKASLDLNYPSFIVILNNSNITSYKFKRVLKNVGDSPSVYRATVLHPEGMKVIVEPKTLTFGSKYSKAEFTMEVEINVSGHRAASDYIGNYGYLIWYESNGKHVVRSPIVSAFALPR